LIWVCPMCSTNNEERKKECCVCGQKRPPAWYKPIIRQKITAFEEKFYGGLVNKCREFFFSLVGLMGILLALVIVARATSGDLPEVLKMLTLLWKNGKEQELEAVPDSAIYLWEKVLAAPFAQVKDNFLYCTEDIGDKFKTIGDNFMQLLPYFGQNLEKVWDAIVAVVSRFGTKIKMIFGNLEKVFLRIFESIGQFIKRIGA